ncbi:MAG: Cobalamin-binding protein precursor [Methanocella sp. PtaU1.Bin125]|nr:MAG: Cobalamin-binding protein precursor [Methanocella sp. PtaU1.Bin125]
MEARYIIITALLVAAIVAVCGCTTVTPTASPATPTPAAQYPMTVMDYYGRTATIDKAPERIVSLSAANTELLFDLGLGSKIVGVDDYSDYPAEAKAITKVSGFAEVSYEKITAVDPDVIFAEDIVGEEAVTRLREMGFPVVEVKNSNLTMIRKSIELFGRVTDTSANATALIDKIDREIAAINAKTAGLNESQKPNVLLLTGFLISSPQIYPYGSGTYGDELLTLTGCKNAAGDVLGYQVMSNEAIIKADPDYIVIPVDGVMCTMDDYNYFKNGNETWMKSLTAVKNGKVFWVDGNLFLRPGPRTPQAGLDLARIVHPELFP